MIADRHGQPIIQATLFKLLGSIFFFLIIFSFLYGSNYWEKEELKVNYNLVLSASTIQEKIKPFIKTIEKIEEDHNLKDEQKVVKLNSIIKPFTQNGPGDAVISGYYDLDLNAYISNQVVETDNLKLKLGKDNKFYHYLWSNQSNKIFIVSYPIYDGKKLIGYAWSYTKNSYDLFFADYKIGELLILTLGLAIIIIIIIQKFIKQIQLSFELFSKAIIENRYDQNWVLTKLPELKPVLDKLAFFTDELKHMNDELELSQLKITQILEGISDGFFALDFSWRFIYLNHITQKLTNHVLSESSEKSIFEVFPQIEGSLIHENLVKVMSRKQAVHWEDKGLACDDKYYEYHAYPFTEGITVFYRDITDFKNHQLELARLERLNLIGQLAAGISHEIRNPLTTVKGFLQFLGVKSQYAGDKEYMELMVSEIDRANLIITDFLSLSKAHLDDTKVHNINTIIRGIHPIIQADAYNNNKEVILDLESLPGIRLNENEIKQLILNLVRNGLEVTPESGKVTIRTYFEEDKVFLEIKDQGPGIPEEIRSKIGTPFFTTKDTGTGLGLAISIGIVRRHHGLFDFETGSDGTTFKITFFIA